MLFTLYYIPMYIYFYTEHYISSRHGVQVWNIFYTRTVGIYIGVWGGVGWGARERVSERVAIRTHRAPKNMSPCWKMSWHLAEIRLDGKN